MSNSDLRSLIDWSKREIDRDVYQSVFRSGIVQRVRQGLGGSHSVVTYPPLDGLRPLDAAEILTAVKPVAPLHMYLHVAFCEFPCGFCHYETRRTVPGRHDSFLSSYFAALDREIRFWTDILLGSQVASVYIGGGTPTVAPTADLLKLLDGVARLTKLSNFHACVEASPITVTAPDGVSKLNALRASGVNRISIGIQSFNEELLLRHRGHDHATAVRAVDLLLGTGAEINVDLMQDLPGQTDESIIEDVAQINALRPHQVTWYILRLHRGSSWFKTWPTANGALTDSEESVRRRVLIRKAMAALGYQARPGGRFVRDALIDDDYKRVRSSTEPHMIGIGASAYCARVGLHVS